jgi:polyhydroxyalkanoate synthesis regulator phasin
MDELIQALVAKTGLTEDQSRKVVEFLKANADKVPGWLGIDLKALTAKLPGGLGGLLG